MKNIFNRTAHFAIGAYIGYHAHLPQATIGTAFFLAYQGIEVASKGDKGYPEVKEAAVGYALGLGIRKLHRWYTNSGKGVKA